MFWNNVVDVLHGRLKVFNALKPLGTEKAKGRWPKFALKVEFEMT
jgi:hypothetical protein